MTRQLQAGQVWYMMPWQKHNNNQQALTHGQVAMGKASAGACRAMPCAATLQVFYTSAGEYNHTSPGSQSCFEDP